MTKENSPSQSEATVDDANVMTGATPMNARTDQEVLRQLAGDIVKVAGTDEPGAVKEYLEEILSDTEGSVGVDERLATFDLLANEQRGEIRRGIVEAGETMLASFSDNSTEARNQLRETAPKAQRGIRNAVETHDQEVGRCFRGQIDTRRAARGQDIAEQAARRGFTAVKKHSETFDAWSKAQQEEAMKFNDEFKKGQAHEQALYAAGTTIQPDYDGEPRDLSGVIDEKVKDEVAGKIQQAIEEAQSAGASPEDAVLAIMTRETGGATAQVIGELMKFAQEYTRFTKTGNNKVRSFTDDTEKLLRRFASNGRDGYHYVRRAEEAVDLFRSQKRKIQEASDVVDSILRQSVKVLDISDGELKRMIQKMSSVTAIEK